RIVANGDACVSRVFDNAVVHIRNVHYVAHLGASQQQEAAQHIDLEKGAEVTDVAVIVDRGPAGVHAQGLAVFSDERVELSGESIEKAEGHRSFVLRKGLQNRQFSAFFDCNKTEIGGYDNELT